MHPSSLTSDFFFFSAFRSAGFVSLLAAELTGVVAVSSDDGCSLGNNET